ncbi:MAG: M20/M25/M40 family metallo-hydrolase [Chloroflexi bacterium]|nr:M20/M25/M40 family metallo-hydrolase [Chloroflexota bacterium]
MKKLAPSVLSLCQQLVRVPSFSGDEKLAADIAARALRDLGFDDVRADTYGNVIAIRRGARPGKTILLDAHLDVVPVTNRDEWTRDPFSGELADGKVWGRGACDDKGPLAAMICAAASIPRAELAGQIIVSASVCEENLTGAAFAHILDQHPADFVIVGEPTELKLGVAQKGRAGIVVHARGKSAHTSRPELGDNAVYKMLEVVNRVRALELPSDPQLGRSIIELTEIVSEPLPGAGFVPHACHARFVERMLPEASREHIGAQWNDIVAGIAGITWEFDELAQRCYTGAMLATLDFIAGWRANETWVGKLCDALRAAGLPGETFAAPFGTNASASAACGIPTFILGPGSIEQAHIVDEWIAVEELAMGERAYRELIRAAIR